MIKILQATISDIPLIQDLAEKIWWPTYSPIVDKVQIRYMLDAIYSEAALRTAIENGSQTFIKLLEDDVPQGFASFGRRANEPDIFKLHKLYVLSANHGKGYGKKLVEEVKRQAANENIRYLDLNVNRYNPARTFYEKLGFKILREEDVPVGPYWMNDYVMRLELRSRSH
jgi:GNAT superfamily N-acetyltransferase